MADPRKDGGPPAGKSSVFTAFEEYEKSKRVNPEWNLKSVVDRFGNTPGEREHAVFKDQNASEGSTRASNGPVYVPGAHERVSEGAVRAIEGPERVPDGPVGANDQYGYLTGRTEHAAYQPDYSASPTSSSSHSCQSRLGAVVPDHFFHSALVPTHEAPRSRGPQPYPHPSVQPRSLPTRTTKASTQTGVARREPAKYRPRKPESHPRAPHQHRSAWSQEELDVLQRLCTERDRRRGTTYGFERFTEAFPDHRRTKHAFEQRWYTLSHGKVKKDREKTRISKSASSDGGLAALAEAASSAPRAVTSGPRASSDVSGYDSSDSTRSQSNSSGGEASRGGAIGGPRGSLGPEDEARGYQGDQAQDGREKPKRPPVPKF